MGEPGLAEAGLGGEAVGDLVLLLQLLEVEGVVEGAANEVRKTGGVLYRKQPSSTYLFFISFYKFVQNFQENVAKICAISMHDTKNRQQKHM